MFLYNVAISFAQNDNTVYNIKLQLQYIPILTLVVSYIVNRLLKFEIFIFSIYVHVIDTYFLIELKIQKTNMFDLEILQSVEIKLCIMKYNGYK